MWVSQISRRRERGGACESPVWVGRQITPQERERERGSVSQGSGASTPTTGPSRHSSYALLTPPGGSLVVSCPPSPWDISARGTGDVK